MNWRNYFRRNEKKVEMSDGSLIREKDIYEFKDFVRELLFIQTNDPDRFCKIAKGTLEPASTMAQQEAYLRLYMLNPSEEDEKFQNELDERQLKKIFWAVIIIYRKMIALRNGEYVVICPIKGMSLDDFLSPGNGLVQ